MNSSTSPIPEHPWFDEIDLLDSLADTVDNGTFVDVGASIGRFSRVFADKGWSVVAVEAAPEIVRRLSTTLAPYENARVVACAASDTDDSHVEFFLSADHWGIHSLQPFHQSHREKVIVESKRLESILNDQDYRDPVFLKVDAEGADLPALRGWNFERSRPRIVMSEFMDSRSIPHFGYGFRDVVRFMAQYGYTAYVSEWSPVEEYARQGVQTTRSQYLGVFSSDLRHDPAWGNLLFVGEKDRTWFEEGLIAYLTAVQARAWETLSEAARERSENMRMRVTIDNRETRISALLDSREALHVRIKDLGEAVDLRDARIAQLEDAVDLRDARIAQLDGAVAARDARIAQLDGAVAARDARIRDLRSGSANS